MRNIEQYRKRFFNLMESTIGDVKPLINEAVNFGGLGDVNGTYTYSNGDIYTGEYHQEPFGPAKPRGYGTMKYSNGNTYTGNWDNGLINGYGTHTWANGVTYTGDWNDNKMNGYGTYTWPDGSKHVGEYKDGVQNGYGTYTYADGRKYVGNFEGDLFNGYGTMTWPDSTKYVGNFEDNLFNGYGVYTKKDGTISKGMWKDGGLVTPDGPETDDVESEVSSSDCNSLKVESDKQTKWNTSNLSSGKVIIGLKNQGPIVKYIQCLLNGKNKELSLGLSDLTVDGVFGSQTKKMVIKFQEKNGLSSDGVVGKDTFLKLV